MRFSKSVALTLLASATSEAYLHFRDAADPNDALLELDRRSIADEDYLDLYARDVSDVYDALIARHVDLGRRSVADEDYLDLDTRDDSDIYEALIARHLDSIDHLLLQRRGGSDKSSPKPAHTSHRDQSKIVSPKPQRKDNPVPKLEKASENKIVGGMGGPEAHGSFSERIRKDRNY